MHNRSWVELSVSSLRANYLALAKLVAPSKVIAVVKANAYGHGLREVAEALRLEVEWFAVDQLDEALVLREMGLKQHIVVLGYTMPSNVREAIEQGIDLTVTTFDVAHAIHAAATKSHPARVHLKLETGLHRQGMDVLEAHRIINVLRRKRDVSLIGASTHFADIEDVNASPFAREQLKRFETMLAHFDLGHVMRHAACSSASMLLPEARMDAVRAGISLYGIWPSTLVREQMCAQHPRFLLRPVLSWKTIVTQVKDVGAGESVGYGRSAVLHEPKRVAVLPIGYFEGIDRRLSNRGTVLIHGIRCQILGRICMNMCMVDVTRVSHVREGDEVILIGPQGTEQLFAEDVAEQIGTIAYEVVARIQSALERRVVV